MLLEHAAGCIWSNLCLGCAASLTKAPLVVFPSALVSLPVMCMRMRAMPFLQGCTRALAVQLWMLGPVPVIQEMWWFSVMVCISFDSSSNRNSC